MTCHDLLRVALGLLVSATAVLCLWSTLIAAIVGGLTVVVVAIDATGQRGRPPPSSDPPDRITVDLRRRRPVP